MIDIDFDKLRRIGLAQGITSRLGELASPVPGTRLARVTETQRDVFTLHDGTHELRARALARVSEVLQADGDALTIGDWVLAAPGEHGQWWIHERIAPVTQIARRANDGRRQTLASNVDTALLVMGMDNDFNLRRMERYIAIVKAADVAPVVVLTKADIGAREHYREMCDRLPATIPVLAVNGTSPSARKELAPWLAPGCTLVLLGASGAGKSTLTNTLLASDVQDTGEVRRGDGRGQHTTTARSLHLCETGACIIDTPGLRTWRPDADAQSLAATYDDVQSFAPLCRFRDCRHEGEPGCAVREHVAQDRLVNFQKLVRDAERVNLTALDRIQVRKKWKKLHKAGAARTRDKRG
ncbi:ribosome small subunit-dependent GTPase A [Ramlibacter albus]|uniref:Small ribosomal subunit biogenesis GTPase RsgA n=1 Tax=Ramlibacter albus TaxID=2079448 RepID=A0A923MEB2_9BURK|nr:ribosome small subunit-dependent GTPase A [Ramlibacter albus]MBC5767996.1 ribosome small subunit-dependent GTPase A [Ramlibacter albus]